MLICRNTEGVHGKKKVGNPCPKPIIKLSKANKSTLMEQTVKTVQEIKRSN